MKYPLRYCWIIVLPRLLKNLAWWNCKLLWIVPSFKVLVCYLLVTLQFVSVLFFVNNLDKTFFIHHVIDLQIAEVNIILLCITGGKAMLTQVTRYFNDFLLLLPSMYCNHVQSFLLFQVTGVRVIINKKNCLPNKSGSWSRVHVWINSELTSGFVCDVQMHLLI